MTFFIERNNGEMWTCLFAAEHYIDPYSFGGPQEMFPQPESPGNVTVFAGRPGWQARLRFDDQVMAVYVWDKIPENPGDEHSMSKWGWKLSERFAVSIPLEKMANLELSVM